MTTLSNYKYKELIARYLDWDRVEDRLARYPHIGQCFSLKWLRSRSKKPPFYSHFLAWLLGVWKNEDRFQHLDGLLAHAMSLPNWTTLKCESPSSNYANFFSLIWELQVAKFLSLQPNFIVSWTKSGPDLQVRVDSDVLYVECLSYRKSFGIELFINEVLTQVHESIKVKHGSNLKFSLPNDGKKLEVFLDKVLSPFLDEQYTLDLLDSAKVKWPVIIPVPEDSKNFYIYVDGDDLDAYDRETTIPYSTGDEEAYLKNSIREAVNNKRSENKIAQYRPNLLAVNFLLGRDYKFAIDWIQYTGQPLPLADFGSEFDGVLFAVCGIDSLLKPQDFTLQVKGRGSRILGVLENII